MPLNEIALDEMLGDFHRVKRRAAQELVAGHEKIKSLLPVAENISSLKNEANEILNTSDPYIGYDIFKDKYNASKKI